MEFSSNYFEDESEKYWRVFLCQTMLTYCYQFLSNMNFPR